ncbi:MAG TPA: CPBP family intramembrane glutamic endopeptidase, partial [Thermoanaerobaculia bacterium]|nr:CPBP family intramembrane glutamic endopeptidase [Thermoanaerobaculia bacterium]
RFLDRGTLAKVGARWPEGGKPRALRQAWTVPLGTLALLGSWLAATAVVAEVRLGGLSDVFEKGTSWWPGPLGSTAALVLYLMAFMVQGGLEEWVVRGYIYHALKERWRWWAAALSSSILFSALHASNPNITWVALVNIVLAGFILSELVERSGSLWSAVVAHGVWNFVVACVLSLPVSGIRIFRLLDLGITGPPLLTGGEFGPEGSLILTFLGLVLAGLLWPRRPGVDTPG